MQGSSVMIVNISGYSGRPDEWGNNAMQKSKPINLEAGNVVLLEAGHCQYGPSLLQVGFHAKEAASPGRVS